MSFLFGWTKYFLSNETKEEEIEEEIEEEQEIEDLNDFELNDEESEEEEEEEEDSEDEDSDNDDLLGGSFETLEEEIKFLRDQNNKLKQRYKYHKSQHKLFKSNFQKTGVMQMKINGKLVNVKQPNKFGHEMSLDQLSQKVEERLPKFLKRADQSTRNDTIYIPSDVENEIGVIDIKTVDWWDMVKFDKFDTQNALSSFNDNDEKLQFEDTVALNGPFIVLREQDIIDAIACFVAQCVMKIPECHNLNDDEMMLMISGTFSELKEKGPLGKMLDWGSFIYYTYGWTSTAYTVYSNAAMAKTVLSCLVSAAFFIGVI